jgi:hypothetical protein
MNTPDTPKELLAPTSPNEPVGTDVAPEPRANIFTVEQENALKRLKAYFPFRIVWGAVNAHTGEFVSGANCTRRQAMNYARKEGWLVATVG